MMKFDNKGGMERYAIENAFYRIFDSYNKHISEELKENVGSMDASEALLFSEGVYLHDLAFADKAYNVQKSATEVKESVRSLFANLPGAESWVNENFDSLWDNSVSFFYGYSRDGHEGGAPGLYGDILIISPFDEKFRNREMMLDGGIRQSYVDVSKFSKVSEIEGDFSSVSFNPLDVNLRNATVYTRNPKNLDDAAREKAQSKYGLFTANDLFGVSDFYPYMSEEEYENVSSSVRDAYSELLEVGYDFRDLGRVAGMHVVNGEVVKLTPEDGASTEAIQAEKNEAMRTFFRNAHISANRGRTIIGALDDRGYQYEIVPSRHSGQIELRVENSGLNVRVFDAPKNINMVGRVYDSRSRTTSYAELNFSNGKFGNKQIDNDSYQYNNDASISQSFALDDDIFVNGVLYSLGETVELPREMTDSVMFMPLVDSLQDGSALRPTSATPDTDIQIRYERSFNSMGNNNYYSPTRYDRKDVLLHMVNSEELSDAVDIVSLRFLANSQRNRNFNSLSARTPGFEFLSGSGVDLDWYDGNIPVGNVTREFVAELKKDYVRAFHMAAQTGGEPMVPSIVEGTSWSSLVQSMGHDDGRDDAGNVVRDFGNLVSPDVQLSQIGALLDNEIVRYNGTSRLMGSYNGGRMFAPGDEEKNRTKVAPTSRTASGLAGNVSMGYVSVRHDGRKLPDDVPARVNWRISSDMDGNSAVRFDSDANDNRAMDYIYSAVTEARDNFRDLINMEELKEMARARVDAALESGEAPDPRDLPDELTLNSVSPIVDELRQTYYSSLVDGYWAENQAPMEAPTLRLRESVPGVHENGVRALLLSSNGQTLASQRNRYAFNEWGGKVMGVDDPVYGSIEYDEIEGAEGVFRHSRTEAYVTEHFDKVVDDVIGAVVDEHGDRVSYSHENSLYVRRGNDTPEYAWSSYGTGGVLSVDGRTISDITLEMLSNGSTEDDVEAWRATLPNNGSISTDSVWFDPVNVVEFMNATSVGREELTRACRALSSEEDGHYLNVRRDFVRVGGSRIADVNRMIESARSNDADTLVSLLEEYNTGSWGFVHPSGWRSYTPEERRDYIVDAFIPELASNMEKMEDNFSSGIMTSVINRRGKIVQHSPCSRFVDGLLKFGDSVPVVGSKDAVVTTVDDDGNLIHSVGDSTTSGDGSVYGWAEVMEASQAFDATEADKYRAEVLQTVYNAVSSGMADVVVDDEGNPDIAMDSNGVVRYKAAFRSSNGTNWDYFEGEVGQFFMPDEYGLYPTSFAGTNNYAIVAGREAYYLDEHRHDGSALERERFKTLSSKILKDATRQVRSDLITHKVGNWTKTSDGRSLIPTVGRSVSLNSSYSHFLASDRVPLDHAERAAQVGMEDSLHRTIIASQLTKRRHIEEDLSNDTSIRGVVRRFNQFTDGRFGYREAVDDRARSNLGRTGFLSTSVVYPNERQIKDSFHIGGAARQMDTSFAVEGVTYVFDNETGSEKAIPSPVENDENILCKDEIFAYSEFDSFYRRQKALGDVSNSFNVSKPVGFAAVPIGGGNQDDAVRVSLRFATENNVFDDEGNVRAMFIDDKASDTHGNKWIISQVIDSSDAGEPQIDDFVKKSYPDDEDGKAQECIDRANFKREHDVWQLFHDNPELDIVGPPDCGVSRFNGGSFREAYARSHEGYERGEHMLHCVDGKDVPGGIGLLRVIIQDKTAENKTTFDNGRKLGWQTSSNVSSMGVDLFMKHVYGANSQGHSRMKESLRAAYGFDLGADGSIYNHLIEDDVADKNVFTIEDDIRAESNRTDKGMLSKANARKAFSSWLGATGGYVEVPFELKWPDVDYTADGNPLHHTGNTLPKVDGKDVWHMPIMAASERRGSEAIDGEYCSHEVTGRYEAIYSSVIGYEYEYDCILRDAAKKVGLYTGADGFLFDKGFSEFKDSLEAVNWRKDKDAFLDTVMDLYDGKNANKVRAALSNSFDTHTESAEKFVERAQRSFTQLAQDVESRNFNGKSNLTKRHILSSKIPGEAVTAVWGSDPTLSLDTVAVGRGVADTLGVKDGDTVFIWRDPVLGEPCMRAVKAVISDDVYGASVNPELAPMINGDFDGDQIGIYKPATKEMAALGAAHMHVAVEMVDFRHVDEEGKHPVMFGGGPDIKRACYHNPEFKERYDAICDKARAVFDKHCTGDGKSWDNRFDPEYLEDMKPVLRDMDVFIHEAHAASVGLSNEALRFDSGASHLKSVYDVCVKTGAKGSMGKLVDYARYCGIHSPGSDEVIVGENDEIDFDSLALAPHTLHSYKEDMSVMNATALKTAGTGEMGKFMQELLMAFPDYPDVACTIAFGYYQKSLDWKHDGEQAMKEYGFMPVVKGILYHGNKYTYDADNPTLDSFKPVEKNDDGYARKGLTKQEWIDVMTASNKALGIKTITPAYLERAADLLVDSDGLIKGTSTRAKKVSSPAMRLAFEENANALLEAADKGERSLYRAMVNLVDRVAHSDYEPQGVREAVEKNGAQFGQAAPYVAKSVVKNVSVENADVVEPTSVEVVAEQVVESAVEDNVKANSEVSSVETVTEIFDATSVSVSEPENVSKDVESFVADYSKSSSDVESDVEVFSVDEDGLVEELPQVEIFEGEDPSDEAFDFIGEDNAGMRLMVDAMSAFRNTEPIPFELVEQIGNDYKKESGIGE